MIIALIITVAAVIITAIITAATAYHSIIRTRLLHAHEMELTKQKGLAEAHQQYMETIPQSPEMLQIRVAEARAAAARELTETMKAQLELKRIML